jgi:pimeloyl-ACP methyl ester carboxylesterase
MKAFVTSSSYSTVSAIPSRSSAALGSDLKKLMQSMNVSGSVVLVGSGIGSLHTRVLASELDQIPGVELSGLVFVEPIVEGTAQDHADINPAFGYSQRFIFFWSVCVMFATISFAQI